MKVINILLVEDDHLDIVDIKRSLDKMKIVYRLYIAKNGEDALALLNGKSDVDMEQLPNVVLIDLNMPRMNGLEFLTVIRNTPAWKGLKCFIITTSEERIDIFIYFRVNWKCKTTQQVKLNANVYCKPIFPFFKSWHRTWAGKIFFCINQPSPF